MKELVGKEMANAVAQFNATGAVNSDTMNRFMLFSQMRIIELLERIAPSQRQPGPGGYITHPETPAPEQKTKGKR